MKMDLQELTRVLFSKDKCNVKQQDLSVKGHTPAFQLVPGEGEVQVNRFE